MIDIRSDRVILNGDVFEYYPGLDQDKFLQFLVDFSYYRPETEIVWILGNHDSDLPDKFKHFSINYTNEYYWEYKSKRYLATHGHQFDSFYKNNPKIYNLLCELYIFAQKIDNNHVILNVFKNLYFRYGKPSLRLAKLAIRHYNKFEIDTIFLAHTHEPLKTKIGEVECLNSGSFDSAPSTYITVSDSGVKLHKIK